MNFLGSTTPSELLGSVTTGVQTTGESLWPLFVFAGIPLAFTIAGLVIGFIRGTFGRGRRA